MHISGGCGQSDVHMQNEPVFGSWILRCMIVKAHLHINCFDTDVLLVKRN